MSIFSITFNKPNKCYVSGDTIHFHLHIYVLENFKARSLSMEVRGLGHTEWMVSRSEMINAKMSAAPAKYIGHEKYFTHCEFLLGGDDCKCDKGSKREQLMLSDLLTGDPIEIEAGTYHYDVEYTLPEVLPNSFEHQLGKVRYVVQANYNIIRGFDRSYTEIFYVTSEVDLNQYKDLSKPVRTLKEISFASNCCCFSEPLQLAIFLPRKGFVPGETIPITIEIENNSKTHINFINIELLERLTFVATTPRVVHERRVTVLKLKQLDVVVAPYQNKLFQTNIALDPHLNWKLFEGSKLFYCDYFVRVEASRRQIMGLVQNPVVETKIQLGTVPITDDTPCDPPSYQEVSSHHSPAFEEVV